MRYKDKELMDEIIECVDDFYIENLRSPYTAEIGEALGIAKSTVHRYLVEMDERNMLEYGRRRIVTPQIRKFSGDITRAGILGSVACGEPEYAEENFEEYVTLPVALFGKGDFFILRAHGYSMVEAGIEPGDIVRRQVEFDGGFAEFDLGILRIIVGMFSRDERNVEPGFRKFGIPEAHSAGHIHVDPAGIPRHVISGVVDRDLVVIPDVDNISRRNDSRPERQGQVVSDRNIVRIQIGQIVLLVDTRILPRENCKNSNSAGSS